MNVLDLFSGIGGFSLGLERSGMKTVAFCEIEEFPRRVLKKHWPEVPCYHDVRTLTKYVLDRDGITDIDVICGGFPCQDISIAGNKKGISSETRSGLWSEIIRLISELQPKFVIVENVPNLLRGPSERPGGWFGRILGDLAECGYDAEWRNIPAGLFLSPQVRERLWLVAYPNQERSARCRNVEIFDRAAAPGLYEPTIQIGETYHDGIRRDFQLAYAGRVLGMGDDVPYRMDRIAACGNAVVPQIAEMIGQAIIERVR